MADNSAFLKAVEDFLNRPRDQRVIDRIQRFAGKAQEKGLMSKVAVFRNEEEIDRNVVLMFFAPVGYRPLFEQEVVFLMNDGMQYESILKMPIHLRKELINRKVKKSTPEKRLYEMPDTQPRMFATTNGEPLKVY